MSVESPAFVRAIRGPLMLITLGGLFAMDYAGGWPVHRTWPLLLIVFGILKLAERMAPRRVEPDYESGPPFPGGTL
jgi:hypothetical protein